MNSAARSIGIQYQQGLKDLLPASDLVEGILNNSDRPPVKNAAGKVIRSGQPLTHFNEVDECAGLDGLFTNRVHTALGQPVENTLHDLRWGAYDASGTTEDYVWVFLISGSAPPAHHIDGYAGTDSLRQPPMYFRLGGGTVRGIAKPGEIVLEPRLRRRRQAQDGPRPRQGHHPPAGRDGTPVERNHGAMADHARRDLRRDRATR